MKQAGSMTTWMRAMLFLRRGGKFGDKPVRTGAGGCHTGRGSSTLIVWKPGLFMRLSLHATVELAGTGEMSHDRITS